MIPETNREETSVYREAATYILGGCLYDDSVIPKVIDAFGDIPTLFQTVDHQLIYKAIVNSYIRDGKSDAIIVAAELEKDGELNRAGGPLHLYDLQARVVDTTNIEWYCGILVETWRRRALERAASQLTIETKTLDLSLEQIEQNHQGRLDEIGNVVKAKSLVPQDVAQIMASHYPPRPEIVPSIVPVGLTILAGSPKVGKSYAMLNMALAGASGGYALGRIKVEKFKTLYIAYESTPLEVQERTAQIVEDEHVPEGMLDFIGLEGTDFQIDAKGLTGLRRLVVEKGYRLIVIDTLQRSRQYTEELKGNAYEQDTKSLTPIYQLAKDLGIGIVLVTHTKKGKEDDVFKEIQGSTGITAVSDANIVMSRDEDYNVRLATQHRNMANVDYRLQFDITSPGVLNIVDDVETESKPVKDHDRQILDLFTDDDIELSTAYIIDRFDESDNAIKKRLLRLVDRGLLEKAGRGKYRLPEPLFE